MPTPHSAPVNLRPEVEIPGRKDTYCGSDPAVRFAAPILILAVFLTPRLARAAGAGLESVSIPRPEGRRHVLVYPPSASGTAPRPLVILLHGHAGSAAQLLGRERSAAPLSVWLHIAARENLILAAPDGVQGPDGRRGWNDGREDAPGNPATDDVGLIAALIDREIATDHADPCRVFIMGMSNGGIMTLRLAVELGPRLAGVAAVSASMAAQTRVPPPSHPLSVMMICGTKDPLVPYAGGEVHFFNHPRGAVIGVDATIARWRLVDKLGQSAPETVELPHRRRGDPTRATQMIWGTDPHGLQVELIRIDGGGHVEPSETQHYGRLYRRIVGPQNCDLEAAEAAWAFFRDKRAAGE